MNKSRSRSLPVTTQIVHCYSVSPVWISSTTSVQIVRSQFRNLTIFFSNQNSKHETHCALLEFRTKKIRHFTTTTNLIAPFNVPILDKMTSFENFRNITGFGELKPTGTVWTSIFHFHRKKFCWWRGIRANWEAFPDVGLERMTVTFCNESRKRRLCHNPKCWRLPSVHSIDIQNWLISTI